MRTVSRSLLTGLLAVGLLGAACATARGGEPALMARLSVRNPAALADKVAALVAKFDPQHGALVGAQLRQFLAMGAAMQLDLTKPVALLVFSGKGAGGPVDPLDVGELNPKELPKPALVVHLRDEQGFRAAATPENPLFAGRELKIQDGCAVLAQDARTVVAAAGERLAGFRAYPAFAGDSDVCVTGHNASSIREYRADIERLLAVHVPRLAAQMQNAGGPPQRMAEALVAVAKCAGPVMKLSAEQTDRASLALTFDAESIHVRARIQAVGDSALHTLFTGHPPLKTDLAKYLPSNAVLSAAGSFELERMKPLALATFDALAGPLELPPDAKEKMLATLFDTGQKSESAMAIPGGGPKGMPTLQVLRVENAAKYREAVQKAIKWQINEMMGKLMKVMGTHMEVAYTPDKRQYKGVAVGQYAITVRNEFLPQGAQPPPNLGEIAVADDVAIVAGNIQDGAPLNAVIDRIRGDGTAGLDTDKGFLAAKAAAPKDARGIIHVSLGGFVAKMMEEQVRQQPMMAMLAAPFKFPPQEEPICGNIRFGRTDVGATMEVAARIPHEPVIRLAKQVQQLIRTMMGMGGGEEPPPEPFEPEPPKPDPGPEF